MVEAGIGIVSAAVVAEFSTVDCSAVLESGEPHAPTSHRVNSNNNEKPSEAVRLDSSTVQNAPK